MRRTILMSAIVIPAVLLIAGVAYAMTINCNGGECTGTNNADTMNGSPQADKMLALEGGDTLYGGGGMDALKGKGGGDMIFGGENNDIVKGGDGGDRVDGGEGDDIVRGGTHSNPNDHARDVLICGPGRDRVYFVRGQDVLEDCEIKRPSN
jgi:Ca2+-binding RTX toxin-like protein